MRTADKTYYPHPGCHRRLNPSNAVFNDQTVGGWYFHVLRRKQKEIGGGLAARDLGRTEDVRRKTVIEICNLKSKTQLFRIAARCHAFGQMDGVQSLLNARDGFEFARISLGYLYHHTLMVIIRQAQARLGFDNRVALLIGHAYEAAIIVVSSYGVP